MTSFKSAPRPPNQPAKLERRQSAQARRLVPKIKSFGYIARRTSNIDGLAAARGIVLRPKRCSHHHRCRRLSCLMCRYLEQLRLVVRVAPVLANGSGIQLPQGRRR